MQRIGQLFVLHHGPVTITIEGLPDTVLPESVTLDIGVHSHYVKGWSRQVDGFATNFVALGGRETFPGVDPTKRFSCQSHADADGLCSKLTLFPPDPPTSDLAREDAFHAALTHERELEAGPCARTLVGLGDDTYDPMCSLPFGHEGTCKP